MKKMKKIVSLLIVIVLLAALVCGCASTPSTDANDSKELSCTIMIDATKAKEAGYTAAGDDGMMLKETTVEFSEGETAYDVLSEIATQKNLPIVKAQSGTFVYITSINSLTAGDLGASSGWMYSVNGEFVQVSCSEYAVQDGDAMVFVFTCDGGTDIGAW